MDIKILWTWCAMCMKLEENVRIAVEKMWIRANVEHIFDMEQILGYWVMSLPSLVVNWKILSQWNVANTDQIIDMLTKLDDWDAFTQNTCKCCCK